MKAFARVRALADHQRGLVARPQLLAAGVSPTTIQRLIGLGLLDPVIPGIYRTPGAELDHRLRLRAALLGLRGSIVSHESAAELHGMGGVIANRPVVTVPIGRTHRYPDMRVHESTDITSDQVVEVDSMPTSRPARVIIELAQRMPIGRLKSLIESSIIEGHVELGDLEELASRLGRRGKPGTIKLRNALTAIGPGVLVSASILELKGYQLLAEVGLAPPMTQFRPTWLEFIDGCVDFCYPEHLLIIEIDGRRWHTRTSDFERDRYRDNLAQIARWRILRFTWDQIVNHPGYVIDTIRKALAG